MASPSEAGSHDIGPELPLTAVLQSAGVVGVWEYRLDRGLVYADEGMAFSYGVDPLLAARGQPPGAFRKAIHPADLPAAVAALQHAALTGSEYRARYRLLQGEKPSRLIEVRGRCKTVDGHVTVIAGVNLDVTGLGETPAEDPLHRLAELCVEARKAAEILRDDELAYFVSMLNHLVGQRLTARLTAGDH